MTMSDLERLAAAQRVAALEEAKRDQLWAKHKVSKSRRRVRPPCGTSPKK